MADNAPKTMSEHAKAAAAAIAKDQQKRPGKKVRVVAIKEGFDGFKLRQEGERFVYWLADDAQHPFDPSDTETDPKKRKRLSLPTWLVDEKEYDRLQRAAQKAERDAEMEDLTEDE